MSFTVNSNIQKRARASVCKLILVMTHYPQVSTSDSENSGDYAEESPDEAFKNTLTDWAIDFRITMVALTALLSDLRSMHPNLTKDAWHS